MTERPRHLRGYPAVVDATGGDPYARWGIDHDRPLEGLARDGAVLWVTQRHRAADLPWANAVGPPEAVADLVEQLVAGRTAVSTPPRGITVPAGTIDLLAPALRPREHGDWTWWWTDRPPPPQTAEPEVVELDVRSPAVRDELAGLLREASPTASADVDDPGVRTWAGLRASGTLVAAAADRPYVRGVPHLASIATHPQARRRGYGGAVTAWLTRRRLVEDEAAVVSLGMYSANDPARSVYLRLGFTPEHRFTSGALPQR